MILKLDSSVKLKITRFIKDYVAKSGAQGVVLGVSGGVDSATTAALCAIAIGGERVLGLYMPEKTTYSRTDYNDAKLLAKKFRFKLKKIDLTTVLEALYQTLPDFTGKDKLSQGNLKARIRMLTLYYYANHQGFIVVGSSDKSETMIGYFTKWGDGAADIAPIMDLYKSQVRQLANQIGVSQKIVNKPSTPALWPNQKAEEEIGLKYEVLDLILFGLERFMPTQTIAKQLHLPIKRVAAVKERWLQMEHKRKMPLTTKLEYRTVNADFRLARTTEFKERCD